MGSGYIPYDYVVRQLSAGAKQDEWPGQLDLDDLTWEFDPEMPADIADIDKW
jgi:hypothetical protein